MVSQLYDENGTVIDADGKESQHLWMCGHFVAKAVVPVILDLENDTIINDNGENLMLWITKSAIQHRGTDDERRKLLAENETVLEWSNEGKAESPKFRPGKFPPRLANHLITGQS